MKGEGNIAGNREDRYRGRMSRRDAIQWTMGALGMAALGPAHRAVAESGGLGLGGADADPSTQKFLVVVELNGGNDGLNMVVPQGLSNYAAQRPSLALDAGQTEALNSGAFATGAYRLHGALPNLAQLYRDGDLGIVQKVGYPNANGSHATSSRIWATGRRESLLGSSGWIARYADQAAATTLGAIAVNRGRHPSLVGGGSNPLMVGSLASFRFDADGTYFNNHLHRLGLVKQMLEARSSGATRDALLTGHDLADQLASAVSAYTSTADYGTGRLGTAMKDIARMLQAGFETRVFYTGIGGFDTHAAQGTTAGRQASLFVDLDNALQGFADDCKAMGIWNNAIVCVVSEFGRRNFENGSGGTDHGKANVVLVTGGAVRGGLHGPAITNEDLDKSSLPYGLDFRAIYRNVLEDHLGMTDPGIVFGEELAIPTPVQVVA